MLLRMPFHYQILGASNLLAYASACMSTGLLSVDECRSLWALADGR